MATGKDGRVVSNFIMQALSGEDITIYGDGGQTRSFCFVDDLVEGLVRLMNNENEVTLGRKKLPSSRVKCQTWHPFLVLTYEFSDYRGGKL